MLDFNLINMFLKNSYICSSLTRPFILDFCWEPLKLNLPFLNREISNMRFENNNLPMLFDFNKPRIGISGANEQPLWDTSFLLPKSYNSTTTCNNNEITSLSNNFISNSFKSTTNTKINKTNELKDSNASSSINRTTKLKGIDITKFPETEVKNAEKLYEKLNLQAKGLDYGVFICAYIGYNKIKDKGSGYLGIFDTTQNSKADRYYLIDMKNISLVGQCGMKAGTGNMNNVTSANKIGSNATLSGFEKIGEEYQSTARWKRGRRIYGLEKGINDSAINRCTVAHYTELETTLGCKGIPAIMKENGNFDHEASLAKLRKFFPTGTILFTAPTGTDYWAKSKIL